MDGLVGTELAWTELMTLYMQKSASVLQQWWIVYIEGL